MKLRKVAKLSEAELGAIFAALATHVGTYEQVVEVSSNAGGLGDDTDGSF